MNNMNKSKNLANFLVIYSFFMILLAAILLPSINSLYSGNYIKMDIMLDKDKCLINEVETPENCDYLFYPGNYTFTQEDIEFVNNLEGVEEVFYQPFDITGINTDGTTLQTNETVSLRIDPIKDTTFPLSENDSNYTFSSIQFPYEYLMKTGTSIPSFYATYNTGFTENTSSFPSVVLPEFLATYNDYKQGEIIDLPVIVTDQKGVTEETTRSYFVTGIYDTDNVPQDKQNAIYIDYYPIAQDYTIVDEDLLSTKFLTLQSSNMGSSEQHSQYFTDLETFLSNSTTSITTLNIFTTDESSSVYTKLEEQFPNYTISNYQHPNSQIFSLLRKHILLLLVIYIVLFILMILLLIRDKSKVTNTIRKDLMITMIYSMVIFIAMYFFEINFLFIYKNSTIPYAIAPFIYALICTIFIYSIFYLMTFKNVRKHKNKKK